MRAVAFIALALVACEPQNDDVDATSAGRSPGDAGPFHPASPVPDAGPDAASDTGLDAGSDTGPDAESDTGPDAGALCAEAACFEFAEAPSEDEACPGTRFIGVLADMQGDRFHCPGDVQTPSGRYVSRHLFAEEGAQPESLPPVLQRFCLLEWAPAADGAPPTPEDIGAVEQNEGAFSDLSADCQVAGTLTTEALPAIWQELSRSYIEQADALYDGARTLPGAPGNAPAQIRVAVADTSPHGYDGEAAPGNSEHGLAMGRFIRQLGCPPSSGGMGPCVAQVSNQLALPRIDPAHVSLADGGYFGFQTEVALAISGAVRDWQLHNRNMVPAEPPQPRLVVNLSLGWDPRWGGEYAPGHADRLPAQILAVHSAIEHARCQGALVIAAAGNASGGPDASAGPMFPAGWETRAAPDAHRCARIEGPGYDPNPQERPPIFGAADYDPLVFSAAGVRADDHPLANTRPGGRPRLATPGFMAAAAYVDDLGALQPTEVETGSSVAAATLSAGAAVVWGYRPDLTGPEIMQVLYDQGVSLDPYAGGADAVRADYCLDGFSCADLPIKRVALCQALAAACAAPAGRCPAAPPVCATPAAYGGTPPDFASRLGAIERALAAASVTPSTVAGDALQSGLPLIPECGPAAGAVHYRTAENVHAYPARPCPDHQLQNRSTAPWAGPQPPGNPCPHCYWSTSSGKVGLFINTEYDPLTVFADGKLLLEDKYGGVVGSYSVEDLTGLSKLYPGDVVYITDFTPSTASVYTVEIVFSVDDKHSSASEMIWW